MSVIFVLKMFKIESKFKKYKKKYAIKRFSKGPLKRDFLDIYLTALFGVGKFKNTSAMRVIPFSKMVQIGSKFRKCKIKLAKSFLFQR